jgi:hypothetical protein
MNHCGGPLGIELEGQLWWLGLTRQEIVVWMDCSGLHDKQFGSQQSHKSALWRTSWLIWQFRGDLLTFKVDHDFIFLKLHFLRYLLFSGRGRYGFDFQWMRFMNHIYIWYIVYLQYMAMSMEKMLIIHWGQGCPWVPHSSNKPS